MEKTNEIILSNSENTKIQIEYSLDKKFYSEFIKNMSIFYKQIKNHNLETKLSPEIKESEEKNIIQFVLPKKQLKKKIEKFIAIDTPCSFEILEFLNKPPEEDSKIGIFAMTYGFVDRKENVLGNFLYDRVFIMGKAETNIGGLVNFIAFSNPKEKKYFKQKMSENKKEIINSYGKEAYSYIYKMYSYKQKEKNNKNYILKKKYITENTENIFVKNKKFIVKNRTNLLIIKQMKKRYFMPCIIESHLIPKEKKIIYNILFSKKMNKIILDISIPTEFLPKNKLEVNKMLKNEDMFLEKVLNYFDNVFSIYKYVLTEYSKEILFKKL